MLREVSTSPYLLSLYAYMKDSGGNRYGLARISIDYSFWFQSVLKESLSSQDYFLITGKGETVARSSKKRCWPRRSPGKLPSILHRRI